MAVFRLAKPDVVRDKAVAGSAVARERTGNDMARNMAVAGVDLTRDRVVAGFCG